jgi:hypothetical protein
MSFLVLPSSPPDDSFDAMSSKTPVLSRVEKSKSVTLGSMRQAKSAGSIQVPTPTPQDSNRSSIKPGPEPRESTRPVSIRMSIYYIFLQIRTSMLFVTQYEKDLMETLAQSLRDEYPAAHLRRVVSDEFLAPIMMPSHVRIEIFLSKIFE